MTSKKLSQIASGSAFVAATDSVVTVRSGTTDVLTTLGPSSLGATFTDGQLLIGATSTGQLVAGTLTAGSGITIVNGTNTITISSGGANSTTTGQNYAFAAGNLVM